ncbi:MAG: hypothetical protein U9Q69_05600 [Nanoarchaeota archaeon]|nr:hypothetical protein [Nanoarchaeota archaeon]
MKPGDQTRVGPPFPDVDCDGIADCVDTWLYGAESSGNPYGDAACTGQWDCSEANAPWSDCHMTSQGYGQTRMVRDIGFYGAPGCTPAGGVCPPPPSFKACIEEEEEEAFPVFTWFNMLLVTMMLISFYAIRIKKL